MANYPINYHLYTFFWNKYRPVILKLMVDSAKEPQQYQFIQHEFKDINPKEKGGHSFTLQIFNSKAINNIKSSVVAQDLLIMLEKSKKSIELTEEATYELILDKHFMLQVSRIEQEATEEVETTSEEVAEDTKPEETETVSK
ncbi:MAG: hypothetical protein OEW67_11365 [Cyclobacteriaceae bacterium]|nr:hypothetical protein [Cyclobacteriaceae bacterium]